MFLKLLLLFLVIPFIEVTVLIKLASKIGFWPTLALQIGTAVAGAALAKLQGWLIWTRIARELSAGRLPAEAMVDGLLVFLAGVVLITPGLLTDLLGLLILIPAARSAVKRWLRRRFERMIVRRDVKIIDIV